MEYISYENVSGAELVASPYTMAIGTEVVSTTGVIPELEAKIGLGVNKYVDGVLQTYFVQANPVSGNLGSNNLPVSVTPAATGTTGFWEYSDGATVGTPISIAANDTVALTVDAAGDLGSTAYGVPGAASMWQPWSNKISFGTRAFGDIVDICYEGAVTTTTANQSFQVFINTGIGSAGLTARPMTNMLHFKTVGTHLFKAEFRVCISDDYIKSYLAEMAAWSDATATVRTDLLTITAHEILPTV